MCDMTVFRHDGYATGFRRMNPRQPFFALFAPDLAFAAVAFDLPVAFATTDFAAEVALPAAFVTTLADCAPTVFAPVFDVAATFSFDVFLVFPPKIRSQLSPYFGVVPVRTIGPLMISYFSRLAARRWNAFASLREPDGVVAARFQFRAEPTGRTKCSQRALPPGFIAALASRSAAPARRLLRDAPEPSRFVDPLAAIRLRRVTVAYWALIDSSMLVTCASSKDSVGCWSIRNAVPFLPANAPLTCFHSDPSLLLVAVEN